MSLLLNVVTCAAASVSRDVCVKRASDDKGRDGNFMSALNYKCGVKASKLSAVGLGLNYLRAWRVI